MSSGKEWRASSWARVGIGTTVAASKKNNSNPILEAPIQGST